MRVVINEADYSSVQDVLAHSAHSASSSADLTLSYCYSISEACWVGFIDSKPMAAWGLIPPSLMSDKAYLWLLTTDQVKGHEFLFVRHSQIFLESMLRRYPTIYGHCDVRQEKSIRWLRWLGARFDEPKGLRIEFSIRGKNNG